MLIRPNRQQDDILCNQAKHESSLQSILETDPSALVEVCGYTLGSDELSVVDGAGVKAQSDGRTQHTEPAAILQQRVLALRAEDYNSMLKLTLGDPTRENVTAAIVARGGTSTAQNSDRNYAKNMRDRVRNVLEDMVNESTENTSTKWMVAGFQQNNTGPSFNEPNHRKLLKTIAGRKDDPGLPGSKPSLILFKLRHPTGALPLAKISFIVDVPKYGDKSTDVCDISKGIHRAGWYALGGDAKAK